MHTPGPWRRVRVETPDYYTDEVEGTRGHIASVVGWTNFGAHCAVTEANTRLIEHAPDMADALRALLAWAEMMGGAQQGSAGVADGKLSGGGWDAPCWEQARRVLDRATTPDDTSHGQADTTG